MSYTDATSAGQISQMMAALSDPTRRAIVDRLRAGPLAVGDLACAFPISRPAISQHLRVLTDAGLLVATPSGNRRFYAIAPEGLAGLRLYLDGLWSDALAAFAAAAREQAKRDAATIKGDPK